MEVDSGDTTVSPDSAAWKVLDFNSDGSVLGEGSRIGAGGAIALWGVETGERLDLLVSEPLEMSAFVNTNRMPGSVADLAWTRSAGTVVWDTRTGQDRVVHRFGEDAPGARPTVSTGACSLAHPADRCWEEVAAVM